MSSARSGSGMYASSASISSSMHLFAASSVGFSQRLQRRTLHDRNVVPGKLVLRQKLPNLQLHQLQQLLVVHLVHLVQEHHDVRNVHLTRQKHVLTRLRHRTVRRRHHQDRTVHLRRTRDHVLHVVRVTRTVHVRVVTVRRLVLHVRRRDRDPALPLFRSLVDLVERHELRQTLARLTLRDRRRQRRLAVIHVTDRPHVHVRLRPLELLLGHGVSARPPLALSCGSGRAGAHDRDRTADLVLTKDVLYQLSYVSLFESGCLRVERETGFEPATPSLEGSCSSQLSYSRVPRCANELCRGHPGSLPPAADRRVVERGGFEPPKE